MAYCLLDGAQSSQSPVASRQSPVLGSPSPLSVRFHEHSLTFVLHYLTHSLSLSLWLSPTQFFNSLSDSLPCRARSLPSCSINIVVAHFENKQIAASARRKRKECLGNSTTLKGSSNFMLYANVIYASL